MVYEYEVVQKVWYMRHNEGITTTAEALPYYYDASSYSIPP